MSTENVISRNPVTWPHSGKQKSRPGSKGVAMRASTTVSLLGFLLVASQVGSGHASYPCTSDADCQYEGCNDKDCSTAVSTHPNIGRCNGGRWDAECTCSRMHLQPVMYVQDVGATWVSYHLCSEERLPRRIPVQPRRHDGSLCQPPGLG